MCACFALIYFFAPVSPLWAQETPEEFVMMMIEAVNSNDEAMFLDLLHPESRKRLAKDGPDALNKKVARMLKYQIPKDYTLKIETISENSFWNQKYDLNLKRLDMSFQYAVFLENPSHIFSITYKNQEGSHRGLGDPIVKDSGKWYALWPIDEIKIQ